MRSLLAIITFSLFTNALWSQPEPCNPDAMTSTCLGACVVCDINGFTGRNNLTVEGQTFSGFCTTIFHNMSYIAFVAGTENLTLNVAVNNCTSGDGIEVGIFESLDCQNFSAVTDCNTDVPANGNATFSNLVPLVIGQYYYLIMDGSKGDICDWTFNVISGSTLVGDLTTSGVIVGPSERCPEINTTYMTTPEVGATFFNWTLNGVAQNSNTTEIDITFPTEGIYELCVTAANVCDEAPPSCTTINVASPEPNFLVETICANDCIEVAGETVCETGMYDYEISLPNGCDSIVVLDLIVLPEIAISLEINLCIGENFTIGNTAFATTGVFIETIPNAIGCDSTVTLDLTMIDCELIGALDFTTPICNGDENATLLFSVQNGIPPFTYEWNNITNTTISGFGTANLLTDILVENIPAGIYQVYITDSLGDDIVFIQEVMDPSVLTAMIDATDYNGYNLTCFNAEDGAASVIGNGGVFPYTFLWNNNEAQQNISNLSAGFYEVTLTDSNGCATSTNLDLIEPDMLEFMANYINPNCDGPETGIIQLDTISGGTAPYTFALDQNGFISSDIFQDLGSGNYDYAVTDANGCSADTSASLYAPDIPVIFLEEDKDVDLGFSTSITAFTNNTTLTDISWTNIDNSLACENCLETDATPVNDTEYVLTVTSIDDCSTSDSILITVNKIRDVFIPNVFSPNGDGINDYFFINANRSVAIIKNFKIFSRWGELIYDEADMAPNQASTGWDGYFNGAPVDIDVFVWVAEVEYLDGEISLLSGDVTLVK